MSATQERTNVSSEPTTVMIPKDTSKRKLVLRWMLNPQKMLPNTPVFMVSWVTFFADFTSFSRIDCATINNQEQKYKQSIKYQWCYHVSRIDKNPIRCQRSWWVAYLGVWSALGGENLYRQSAENYRQAFRCH